jgi:hypothetical protein
MGWHRARERSTLRQPDHSVFGRMISCSARYTDQAADRGAVYDRAASLLAHLAQLVLHAVPDAAEIDRIHAIEFFAAGISGFPDFGVRTRTRLLKKSGSWTRWNPSSREDQMLWAYPASSDRFDALLLSETLIEGPLGWFSQLATLRSTRSAITPHETANSPFLS